jgi:hypothetical protein
MKDGGGEESKRGTPITYLNNLAVEYYFPAVLLRAPSVGECPVRWTRRVANLNLFQLAPDRVPWTLIWQHFHDSDLPFRRR